MRYIWDLYPQYRASAGPITRAVMSMTAPSLRQWDVSTSHRVDHFIANSAYVARRIERFYRREAQVIHPPVDLSRFTPATDHNDFYLCAGQITPYKKIELAVEACTRMNKKLVVMGAGATAALQRSAGPTVQFLGAVDDSTMTHYFARCKALLFPGVEDFGIVPLEVMASGRPVIAFAKGGALETVVDGKTGFFFHAQTVDALADAMRRFEGCSDIFETSVMQAHSRLYSTEICKSSIAAFVTSVLPNGACIR